MATHYYTGNLISKVKVKQLRENLKETLIIQKEKGKLDFLVYSSMVA